MQESYPSRTDANETHIRNYLKCGLVKKLYENGLAPFVNITPGDPNYSAVEDTVCPPLFEGASCFPATYAGTLRIIPCMDSYAGVEFNTAGKIISHTVFGRATVKVISYVASGLRLNLGPPKRGCINRRKYNHRKFVSVLNEGREYSRLGKAAGRWSY